MDFLFQEHRPYEQYKDILSQPLEADYITDANLHDQKALTIIIVDDKLELKHIESRILLKNIIDRLYFVHVDFGKVRWDDKYWFFIGKLNDKEKNLYFVYESGCCGTGFGLGEQSLLYMSEKQELLCEYGLTNKQRNLITANISERFCLS